MSTTGIDKLKNKEPREALIFEANTCPHCGKRLYIDTRKIRNDIISIRFKCESCDFICPVKYEDGAYVPV